MIRESLRQGLIYAEACDSWPSAPWEKAEHAEIKAKMRESRGVLDRERGVASARPSLSHPGFEGDVRADGAPS